jgi:hypothetical protein
MKPDGAICVNATFAKNHGGLLARRVQFRTVLPTSRDQGTVIE